MELLQKYLYNLVRNNHQIEYDRICRLFQIDVEQIDDILDNIVLKYDVTKEFDEG